MKVGFKGVNIILVCFRDVMMSQSLRKSSFVSYWNIQNKWQNGGVNQRETVFISYLKTISETRTARHQAYFHA